MKDKINNKLIREIRFYQTNLHYFNQKKVIQMNKFLKNKTSKPKNKTLQVKKINNKN